MSFPIWTKVKICGITNLADALLAWQAGADFLGFIFYPPSKRSVDVETVGHIASYLRALENCPALVGVFVDETGEAMAQILEECSLDLAQLSGDEPAFLIGDEASPVFGRAYKALRPTTLAEAQAEAEWYLPPEPIPDQPSLLLDTYHPALHGGTGQTADWSISARLAEEIPGLMLAGGLTPDNVAEAIRRVRPFAVDVASGIESYPGRKDPDLVQAFIAAVRAA